MVAPDLGRILGRVGRGRDAPRTEGRPGAIRREIAPPGRARY